MTTRISRSVRLSAEPVATIRIHIIPNAKIDKVVGERGDVIKIKLRAPAVEGKANTALRCFLAEELNVPQRAIMLVHGQRSRVEKAVSEPCCTMRYRELRVLCRYSPPVNTRLCFRAVPMRL